MVEPSEEGALGNAQVVPLSPLGGCCDRVAYLSAFGMGNPVAGVTACAVGIGHAC